MSKQSEFCLVSVKLTTPHILSTSSVKLLKKNLKKINYQSDISKHAQMNISSLVAQISAKEILYHHQHCYSMSIQYNQILLTLTFAH